MTTSPAPARRHTIAVKIHAPAAAAPARILLLKLDHIGDFITALSAFRLMRAAFAQAEITLLCLPAVVAFAQSTGLFDRVAGFDAIADSSALGRVPGMDEDDRRAAFAALLDGRYMLAADFRHDADTRHWLDAVDAGLRAGFAAPTQTGLDIVLPKMEWDVPAALPPKNTAPPAGLRLELLAHAIIGAVSESAPAGEMFPAATPDEPGFRMLQSDRRLRVGLSLGAGAPLRQWSADYWAALVGKIAQRRDTLFVFFGGPGDKEETKALIARLPAGICLDLTAAMPLAAVPSYMRLLDAYIGCDTGLTHLAAGLGLPAIDIFSGVSNLSVWRARGPKAFAVQAEPLCAPCHLRFPRDCKNGHICMKAVVPDIVYACFEQLRLAR